MAKQFNIKIVTRGGMVEVKAYCYKGIAIHRDLNDKNLWCITHITSGLVMMKCESYKDSKVIGNALASTGIDFRSSRKDLEHHIDTIMRTAKSCNVFVIC